MLKAKDGRDGRDGKRGERGPQGLPGNPPKHEIKDGMIRFTNQKGEWGEWSLIKGADGKDGKDGRDGRDGRDGESVKLADVLPEIYEKIAEIPKPKDGANGKDGKDGKRGPKGEKGEKGDPGEDGLSAYEVWLSEGNQGSISDFWDWLADRVIERLKKIFPGFMNRGGGGGGAISLSGGFGFTLTTRDGSPISSGHQGFITIPYDMRISEWTLLGDASGNCEVDIWVADFSAPFPTVSDSITGLVKPNLSGSRKGRGTDLSGWNTNLKSGQIMVVNVNSNDSIRNLTIGLKGKRF